MSCSDQRLAPLPLTFVDFLGPLCAAPQMRRSRSYSGYTPHGLANMDFKLSPTQAKPDDGESSATGQSTVEASYAFSEPSSDQNVSNTMTEEALEVVNAWPATDGELEQVEQETLWPDTDTDFEAEHASATHYDSQRAVNVGAVCMLSALPQLLQCAQLPLATPMPAQAPTWRPQLPLEALVSPPQTPAFMYLPFSTPLSRCTPSGQTLATPGCCASISGSQRAAPIGAGPNFFTDEPDSELFTADDEGESFTKRRTIGTQQPTDSVDTTMMIRNLPKNLTQQELLEEINRCGFCGLYDFCYLPRDFKSSQSQGFAFVNFNCPVVAARFMDAWNLLLRFGSPGSSPQKLTVSKADLQGLEANIKRWAGPRMRRIRNPALRPFVLGAALGAITQEAAAALPAPAPKTLKLEEHLSAQTAKTPGPVSPAPALPAPAAPTLAAASFGVAPARETGMLALRRARAMMPAVSLQAQSRVAEASPTSLGSAERAMPVMPRLLGASCQDKLTKAAAMPRLLGSAAMPSKKAVPGLLLPTELRA